MSELYDFQTKKSVHIKLSKDTHSKFRIACFESGLSMQSVLQEFAERIVAEDPDAIDMLEDLVMRGRKKQINSLSDLDASSIYDTIERESPLIDDD
tara:strand:- start:229 stop:516 length:288 start_codon:yes stop_codon:yes gene_type:complete